MFFKRNNNPEEKQAKTSYIDERNLMDLNRKYIKREDRVSSDIIKETGIIKTPFNINLISNKLRNLGIINKTKIDLERYYEEEENSLNYKLRHNELIITRENYNSSRSLKSAFNKFQKNLGLKKRRKDNIVASKIHSVKKAYGAIGQALFLGLEGLNAVNKEGLWSISETIKDGIGKDFIFYKDFSNSLNDINKTIDDMTNVITAQSILLEKKNLSLENIMTGKISIAEVQSMIPRLIAPNRIRDLLLRQAVPLATTLLGKITESKYMPKFISSLFRDKDLITLGIIDYLENDKFKQGKFADFINNLEIGDYKFFKNPLKWVSGRIKSKIKQAGEFLIGNDSRKGFISKNKGKILGDRTIGDMGHNMSLSNYSRFEPAIFDAESHVSINTIIPGFLSSILRSVSNSNELLIHDYKSGKWFTTTEASSLLKESNMERMKQNIHVGFLIKNIRSKNPDIDPYDILEFLIKSATEERSMLEIAMESPVYKKIYDEIVNMGDKLNLNKIYYNIRAELSKNLKGRAISGSVLNAFNDLNDKSKKTIDKSEIMDDKKKNNSHIRPLKNVDLLLSQLSLKSENVYGKIQSEYIIHKEEISEEELFEENLEEDLFEGETELKGKVDALVLGIKNIDSEVFSNVANRFKDSNLKVETPKLNKEPFSKLSSSIADIIDDTSNITEKGEMANKIINSVFSNLSFSPLLLKGLVGMGIFYKLSKFRKQNEESDMSAYEDEGQPKRGILENAFLTVVGGILKVSELVGLAKSPEDDIGMEIEERARMNDEAEMRFLDSLEATEGGEEEEKEERPDKDHEKGKAKVKSSINAEEAKKRRERKLLEEKEKKERESKALNSPRIVKARNFALSVFGNDEEKIDENVDNFKEKILEGNLNPILSVPSLSKKFNQSMVESIIETQKKDEKSTSFNVFKGIFTIAKNKIERIMGEFNVQGPLMKAYITNPDRVINALFFFSPLGASMNMKKHGFDPDKPSQGVVEKIRKYFREIERSVEEGMGIALANGGGSGGGGGSSDGSFNRPRGGVLEGVEDLHLWGNTLPADITSLLIRYADDNDLLPSYLVVKLHYEGLWGASDVAKSDNNWSGMSLGGQQTPYTRPSGVVVDRGTARPSDEGGYYMRYKSVEDFIHDWIYLLVTQYNVQRKGFDDAIRGMFTAYGSKVGDYADMDWKGLNGTHYSKLKAEAYLKDMRARRDAVEAANPGQLAYIDSVDPKKSKSSRGRGSATSGNRITANNKSEIERSTAIPSSGGGRSSSSSGGGGSSRGSTARRSSGRRSGRATGVDGEALDLPGGSNRGSNYNIDSVNVGYKPGDKITNDMLRDKRGIFGSAGSVPFVVQVGGLIANLFLDVKEIGGYRPEAGSDHGTGRALDVMVCPLGQMKNPNPLGDAIATWIMQNYVALGIKYIIWQQHIWGPGGYPVNGKNVWTKMEDRGSITQNHFDHVHVSFNDNPGDLSQVRLPDGTLGGFSAGGGGALMPAISVEELLKLLNERPKYMIPWDERHTEAVRKRVKRKYFKLFKYDYEEDDPDNPANDVDETDENAVEPNTEGAGDTKSTVSPWGTIPDGENSIIDLLYTTDDGVILDTEGKKYADMITVNLINNYNFNIHRKIKNVTLSKGSLSQGDIEALVRNRDTLSDKVKKIADEVVSLEDKHGKFLDNLDNSNKVLDEHLDALRIREENLKKLVDLVADMEFLNIRMEHMVVVKKNESYIKENNVIDKHIDPYSFSLKEDQFTNTILVGG